MEILLELGLNADVPRGIDYYIDGVVHGLAAVDRKNRYTVFSYFARDFERKMDRLPIPEQENFDAHISRASDRLVKFAEYSLGWGVTERFLLPKKKFDVYHVVGGGCLPHIRRARTLTTFFDLAVETFPHDPEKRPAPGAVADPYTHEYATRADHLIATGEITKANLIKHYGIAAERISVIPTGIDAKVFRPASEAEREAVRRKYGLPARYFMLIGPFFPEWRSNAPTVIEAFADLAKNHGVDDVDLLFVGSPGQLDKAWDLAEKAGVRDRMRKTGFVDRAELSPLYQMSEAVVHPTSVEGFGYGLEVLASEAPFITSDLPGPVEAVGDDALLVPPKDVKALSAAMLRLLREPELGRSLRERGKARASRVEFPKVAERIVELYGRLAAG